jgi:tetratricopeptide (TPR) repeat protein
MVGVTMNRQVRADTPSRSVSWPVRSGAIPPLAECFISRPETGFDAARGLARGATVVLTQPAGPGEAGRQPLAGPTGTGGTGKTQLAAALAQTLWRSREADLVAWVPAASRDAVLTGYAQALAAAGAPGAQAGLDIAAAGFLGWLAKTSQPWLVVLDDLADPADLDGLWPAGTAGMVLATTRLPASTLGGPGRRILEIGPFSPREALGYLSARLSEDAGMRAGALDLATDLGCLPLGLGQAAAVIADSQTNCRSYRAQFAGRTRQMPVDGAGPDAATVAATWSLSLDRADSLAPPGMAGNALVLVALFDPAGIPGAVLTSPAASAYICGRHATGTPADQGQVRMVLDSLARAGLVTIDPDSAPRTVLMHSLVQAMIQRFIPPAMLEQAAWAAADALLQAWPPQEAEPLYEQALRDGAASLHRAAAGPLWTPEAHPVLLRAGQSLAQAGLTGLGIAHWQNMISTGQVLGQAHASIPVAHDNLAAAYLNAGRTADAVGAYEQSLAEQQRALGADHPGTLATRSGLARACLAAGRESDAVELYESILAEQEQGLGPDHPVTMTTRDDLVAAYLSAGRAPAAIAILRSVLNGRAAAQGPDHPETLTTQAALAAALLSGGELKDAVQLHERILADREQAHGATHPDTMAARASLAYAYRSADRLKHALPVYERTLADRGKVLGPDHPDTLTSLANLASAYHSAHKLKQAMPLYEEAVARYERSQGPGHPDTLAARGNLASAYHSAGRLAQAITLQEQTLEDYERLLGPDHTHALTSRANLASAYHTVGRRAEAVALFERTLADCERLLPPDHPMTQTIRENLNAAT